MRVPRRAHHVTLALAGAAMGGTLLMTAQPAAAVSPCVERGYQRLCVQAGAGWVYADLATYAGHPGFRSNFHSVNIALYQCSVANGCPSNPIAANGDVGHVFRYFQTRAVPYSFGHTYKAVASWTDSEGIRYVAVSTPVDVPRP